MIRIPSSVRRVRAAIPLAAALGLSPAIAGAQVSQTETVRIEYRLIPQRGTPNDPSGVVDLPGATHAAAPVGQRVRFELQYRLADLFPTDGLTPIGLASSAVSITIDAPLGVAALERAELSRFEAQTSATDPPDPVDLSGPQTGSLAPPNQARGLHRPFRNGIPVNGSNPPAPNNGHVSNGRIESDGREIATIIPLALASPDHLADRWYGLYTVDVVFAAPLQQPITVRAVPHVEQSAGVFFMEGQSLLWSTQRVLGAQARIIPDGPGACCAPDGACTSIPVTDCLAAGAFAFPGQACQPQTCCPTPAFSGPPSMVSQSHIAVLTVPFVPTAPVQYRWRRNGVPLDDTPTLRGTHTPELIITHGAASDHGAYALRVTSACGESITSAAIDYTGCASIYLQPRPVNVAQGESVVFSVGAAAPAITSYQWRRNGINLANVGCLISGATTSTLTIARADPSLAGLYDVVIATPCAAQPQLISTPATLAISPCRPAILTQPQPADTLIGAAATFTVAGDRPGLYFRWRRDRQPMIDGGRISGAGTPTLTIADIQPGDLSIIDAIVSSDCGQTLSMPVLLSPQSCTGDANLSGGISIDDIFVFLTSYFAGCP